MRLIQWDEWNKRPHKDALSLPDIPDAELFQSGTGSFDRPVRIHDWEWSTSFGRWVAVCTFADGWHGVTFPKTF
jgi:hypothetical protein